MNCYLTNRRIACHSTPWASLQSQSFLSGLVCAMISYSEDSSDCVAVHEALFDSELAVTGLEARLRRR